MFKQVAIAPVIAAAMLAGCTSTGQYVEPEVPLYQLQDVQITGQAGYRERIAVVPGSTLRVQLQDVSRADAPATVLAEDVRVLSGEQSPFPFALSVKEHELKSNMRYSVRATITDPNGKLAWTTDTSYAVATDQMQQDLGMLNLVRVAHTTTTPMLPTDLQNVQSIGSFGVIANSNPAMTFTSDGRVSGTTGCNTFTGTYTVDGSKIAFGPLATTRRACLPALNDQESRLLGVLNDVTSWKVDQWNRLVLSTDDNRTIVTFGG